jgi:hypothetical protein
MYVQTVIFKVSYVESVGTTFLTYQTQTSGTYIFNGRNLTYLSQNYVLFDAAQKSIPIVTVFWRGTAMT